MAPAPGWGAGARRREYNPILVQTEKSLNTAAPTNPPASPAPRRWWLWLALGAWAAVAYPISAPIAERQRFRVNDLSVISGAGEVLRSQDGTLYHLDASGQTRAVYPSPKSEPEPVPCLDCSVVSGVQLSRTNVLCMSSTAAELPAVRFEVPCRTWMPRSDVRGVIAALVFALPVLCVFILWGLIRRGQTPAEVQAPTL